LSAKTPSARWVLPEDAPEGATELSTSLGVSSLLGELLARRGLADPAAARAFLQPNLSDLHDPSLLPDGDAAAGRIHQAIADREKILVYGDYDVDGVSATVLMLRFLRMVGADASYYVPDRLTEGYGMNADAIRRIAADGTSVIITVDNGTTSLAEVALARELGITMIVTDHHEPGPKLVDAEYIVNPKRADSAYPNPDLCGVAVAFKVAWAVARKFSAQRRVSPELRTFLLDALSLVALGTVSDVMPLTGENRILVHHGLRALSATQSPGLRALMEVSGLGTATLQASHLGYRLGPRINAAGRMARASTAIELLLTDSYEKALEIATGLNAENRTRQETEQGIHALARERVLAECPPREGQGGAIVLWDEGWHPGVIGIVASRLVDEFRRPTLLVAMDGETGRGSGRSIRGFNLFEALSSCGDLMIGFGGHAFAAGIEIGHDRLPALRKALDDRARELLRPEQLLPEIRIDAVIRLSNLTLPAVRELEMLAPHGQGNPTPRLAAMGLAVAGRTRRVGRDGSHLSMRVTDGNTSLRAIAFGAGEREDEVRQAGENLSLVFTAGVNDWNGRQEPELIVKDLRTDSPT
jgi:single-stranded-DNA-specific exonuclease